MNFLDPVKRRMGTMRRCVGLIEAGKVRFRTDDRPQVDTTDYEKKGLLERIAELEWFIDKMEAI
jgi:hypothetical protein